MSKQHEERIREAIRLSAGTMPVEIVARTTEEYREISACLKGKHGNRQISVRLIEGEA